MPLERLLIAKPALALVTALVSILLVVRSRRPGPLSCLLSLCTVLAYFVPDILIHGRGAERQKAIEMELPNTLDQMLISVEAGLGIRIGDGTGRTEWQGPAGRRAGPHAPGHAGRPKPQGCLSGHGRTD